MRLIVLALVVVLGGCANVNFITGDGDIYDGQDSASIDEPSR